MKTEIVRGETIAHKDALQAKAVIAYANNIFKQIENPDAMREFVEKQQLHYADFKMDSFKAVRALRNDASNAYTMWHEYANKVLNSYLNSHLQEYNAKIYTNFICLPLGTIKDNFDLSRAKILVKNLETKYWAVSKTPELKTMVRKPYSLVVVKTAQRATKPDALGKHQKLYLHLIVDKENAANNEIFYKVFKKGVLITDTITLEELGGKTFPKENKLEDFVKLKPRILSLLLEREHIIELEEASPLKIMKQQIRINKHLELKSIFAKGIKFYKEEIENYLKKQRNKLYYVKGAV